MYMAVLGSPDPPEFSWRGCACQTSALCVFFLPDVVRTIKLIFIAAVGLDRYTHAQPLRSTHCAIIRSDFNKLKPIANKESLTHLDSTKGSGHSFSVDRS